MAKLSQQEIAFRLQRAFQLNESFSDGLLGLLSLEEAYQVQFDLAELRASAGEPLCGWKVGLTSKAMQEQHGMHEPCFGRLHKPGQINTPAQLDFDDLILPGFENELCLRLKTPLSGTDVSFDEAQAAIGDVAPALEIVERRSDFRADFPLVIAGNAQQRYFITGVFVPMTPETNLATVVATVEVNGEVQETATGDKVLENPVNSLIWLAAKLSEYGRSLKAGELIMSGSFTKQYLIEKGDKVRTDFDGIGIVDAQF